VQPPAPISAKEEMVCPSHRKRKSRERERACQVVGVTRVWSSPSLQNPTVSILASSPAERERNIGQPPLVLEDLWLRTSSLPRRRRGREPLWSGPEQGPRPDRLPVAKLPREERPAPSSSPRCHTRRWAPREAIGQPGREILVRSFSRKTLTDM
jgi:hypothetical protein